MTKLPNAKWVANTPLVSGISCLLRESHFGRQNSVFYKFLQVITNKEHYSYKFVTEHEDGKISIFVLLLMAMGLSVGIDRKSVV